MKLHTIKINLIQYKVIAYTHRESIVAVVFQFTCIKLPLVFVKSLSLIYEGAPKVMVHILLCWPTTLEADASGTVVEVEPSRQ
jgi:hypothetical protein